MMKLPDSSFNFGVYTPNGEFLSGNLTNLGEFGPLLDQKRIALYLDFTPERVLLGTRLKVRIIGGREERAIFFRQYSRKTFQADLPTFREFFEMAKKELSSVPRIQYEVLGIWDTNDFEIRDAKSQFSAIHGIMGKIILGSPVQIKISGLSSSFSLIRDILQPFQMLDKYSLKIVLSDYLTDADINLSPMVTKPDIEITPAGEIMAPARTLQYEMYEETNRLFTRYLKVETAFSGKSRADIAQNLKYKLIQEGQVIQTLLVKNPKELFGLYQDDPNTLLILLRRMRPDSPDIRLLDEAISEKILSLITKAGSVSDQDIILMGSLFRNITTQAKRERLIPVLISRGIFDKKIAEEALDRNIDTFSEPLLTALLEYEKHRPESKTFYQIICHKRYGENDLLKYLDTLYTRQADRNSEEGRRLVDQVRMSYSTLQYDVRKLNKILEKNNRPIIKIKSRTEILIGILSQFDVKILALVAAIIIVVLVGGIMIFLDPLGWKPVADIGYVPHGTNVTFLVPGCVQGSGVSYTWNFGDGSQPADTQECSINHLYARVGAYDVSLKASNLVYSSEMSMPVPITAVTTPVADMNMTAPAPAATLPGTVTAAMPVQTPVVLAPDNTPPQAPLQQEVPGGGQQKS